MNDYQVRMRNPLVNDGRYLRDSKDVSRRPGDPEHAVLHTTGSGIVAKAMKVKWGKIGEGALNRKILDPEQAAEISRYAAEYYAKQGNKVSGTFLVGWYGELYQMADEDKRQWSAGIPFARAKLYAKGFERWSKYRLAGKDLTESARKGEYDFWKELYTATGRQLTYKSSPTDCFRGRNPDLFGVSIDLLASPYKTYNSDGIKLGGPHSEPWAGQQFTKYQIAAVNILLRELHDHYEWSGDTVTRRHVLPHSLTDPFGRHGFYRAVGGGLVSVGWDPGELDWENLLAPEGYFPKVQLIV